MVDNANKIHDTLNQLDAALDKGNYVVWHVLYFRNTTSLATILGDRDVAKGLLGDAQKLLIKQQNLIKAQAANTADPNAKASLLAALHDLEKVMKDLPAQVKSSINNLSDRHARQQAKNEIKNAHVAVDKSVDAIRPAAESELLLTHTDLINSVDSMPKAVATNNVKDRNDQLKQIKDDIDREKFLINKLREKGENKKMDPRKIAESLAGVDTAFKHFLDQVKTSSASPQNAQEQHKLADAGKALKENNAKLLANAFGDKSEVEKAILDTNSALEESLDKLAAAVRRGKYILQVYNVLLYALLY